MGGKESRPSILSYEEAYKRVCEEEVKRISDAYKRACGIGSGMKEAVFIRDVMGDSVPEKLSQKIFSVMSSSSKGMTFQDLLTTLVLLTRGRNEERLKLTYAVYCDENETVVTSRSMSSMVLACEKTSLPHEALKLFRQNHRVNYEIFKLWLMEHSNITSVARWLRICGVPPISLTDNTEMPNFYQTLAGVTHLVESDIISLEKVYWLLKAKSKSGKFDLVTFADIVSPPLPGRLVKGFFNAFDENFDGHIDFKELACGVSACGRGPVADQLKFCFKMFDEDRDGKLSPVELEQMIVDMLLVEAMRDCTNDSSEQQIEDSIVLDAITRIKKHSFDKEYITLQEYQLWSYLDPLPCSLLSLIIEICHITLGLKPKDSFAEGSIIHGWVTRACRRGYRPNDTWYLVSGKWWSNWKSYTEYGLHSCLPVNINGTFQKVTRSNSVKELKITQKKSDKSKNHPGHAVKSLDSTKKPPPGPIDNSDIVIEEQGKVSTLTDEGGRLKEELHQTEHFEAIPSPIWKALHSWYGGSPSLPRIVPQPQFGENPWLELRRLQFFILRHQKNSSSPPISFPTVKSGNGTFNSIQSTAAGVLNKSVNYVLGKNARVVSSYNLSNPGGAPKRSLAHRATFSRRHTVAQMTSFLSQRLRIPAENMRVWHLVDENFGNLLEEENRTLEEIKIPDGSKLLLEVRNPDMSWPEELSQIARNQKLKSKEINSYTPGTSGLSNLGNTCFMNSAVQCISNTYPLTKYFLDNFFQYELNKTNPIGMKGQVAKMYNDLVKDLWSGINKSLAPLKLRWTISKYAPRFNGCSQHDSQELLSFLLDGLHEDLNRVQEKPYVELKDSDGRPNEVVAQEAWLNHLSRNQSIIVDLFHGQIKSQVRCLSCQTFSVRFDPFTFLSLPLPMDNSMHLNVILVKLDGKSPTKYELQLNVNDRFTRVAEKLAEKAKLPVNCILLAEVCSSVIKRVFSESLKVRSTSVNNIYAYETPPVSSQNTSSSNTVSSSSEDQSEDVFSSSLNIKKSVSDSDLSDATSSFSKSTFTSNDLSLSKSATSSDIITKFSTESRNSEDNRKNEEPYVIALHRKTSHSDIYFLSIQKHRLSLFGIPIIIPCKANGSITNSQLYNMVWTLVSRLLSPLPVHENGSMSVHNNHALDCDESMGSKYPFTLRCVQSCGLVCGNDCPWYTFCKGCVIVCDESLWMQPTNYIAIDWEPTALHLRYQLSAEKEVLSESDEDLLEDSQDTDKLKSSQCHMKKMTLHSCLNAFCTEEDLGLDELYHCSKCKKRQLAKKKLDIWRLPPILIVHLKRFQLVNNTWIKSHKVVDFPWVGFDPVSYMSQTDHSAGDNPHQSEGLQDIHEDHIEKEILENPLPTQITDPIKSETNPKITPARKRQPSFREETPPLYDLFAMSCHSGVLGGGHYVAYAKNYLNDKWYCYNDSSCKEISVNAIDVESAYTLFYQRQNLAIEDFMPNIENMTPVDVSSIDEDYNSDFKKYCILQ